MAVTQKVTLYNNKFTVPPVINAVQNDTDRQVEAYFGDFTLQVGMTGKLSFIRSDGTHYEVSATLNTGANTATAELDQALTQAGVTQAQLKITDSGNVGSTFTFMIKVQPDVAGISVPQDGWSAQEFDQRLTDAENAIDAVEEDVADLQDKEYDYAPVITDTISGAIASFPDGADGYPLKECVVNIKAIQAGSGDPSPDNVRPISGWSSAKVTRTGKNVLKTTLASGTSASVTAIKQQDGSYNLSGTANAIAINIWLAGTYITNVTQLDAHKLMFFKAGTTITFKDCKPFFFQVDTQSMNKNYGWQNYAIGAGAYTVTLQYDVWLTGVRVPDGVIGTNYDGVTLHPQIEISPSASDYEPYTAQTVTISLGDTRYGAVLDVTRGKLRVKYAQTILNGSETWYSITNGFRNSGATDMPGRKANGIFYCDRLKDKGDSLSALTDTWDAVWATNLNIRTDSLFADADAFKTWLESNNLQCVYELDTPVEYDLTPTEITTLLGINNVWADTGDVEVEYCADTKTWILKKIAEALA